MSGQALTLLQAFIFYSGQDNWLWAFAGLAAGMYWFYRGFRLLQRRRLILDIPASKIRSASIGLVELSGLAVGPYTMQAPLSGVPCYYYRSLAWQLEQSGKSNRWEKVADESLHLPFYLDDNTGRVLVDPQGAELDIHRDFHDEFHTSLLSSRLDLPSNVASFLARHELDASQKLKLEEYCIKPKNALFILGTLAPNPGVTVSATPVPTISDDPIKFTFNLNLPEVVTDHFVGTPPLSPAAAIPKSANGSALQEGAGHRLAPEVVRLQGSRPPSSSANMTQQEKVAAALVRAGIANPAAWAAPGVQLPGVAVSPAVDGTTAGTAGGTRTATATAPESEFDLNPKAVLLKSTNNPSFFVSWRSQREVVQSLGWKSTLMIWGGPALSLVSLFILLQHFGWM